MTNYNNLVFESHKQIVILKINREKQLNSLSLELIEEIQHFVNDVFASDSVKCLIITGSGERAFVAGADIKYMASANEQQIKDFISKGQELMKTISGLNIPVIAMVNGFALGGGLELALACDFIFASETAELGLVETKLGLIPGFGGTQRIIPRVGLAKAKQLIFLAETIKAEEALKIGLIDKVIPANSLKVNALEFAKQLSEKSKDSLSAAKRAINKYFQGNLSSGLEVEENEFIKLFNSTNAKEGVTAFLEKRAANFK